MSTELVESQERLRHSEERFRGLVDSLPGLVWTTDQQGCITFVNRQLLVDTALDRDRLIGSVWLDLLHPEDRARVAFERESSQRKGETYEGEFRLSHHSDAWRWYVGRVIPIRDSSGQVIEWLGTSMDIDRRKRAKDRLEALGDEGIKLMREMVEQRTEELTAAIQQTEQALAEKTVLLQEVHHRVKNNLAVISSLLAMQAKMIQDQHARRALTESQQRIQSMALIHEHLYGTSQLNVIDFAEYARQLAFELLNAYGLSERVSISFETDPIEVGVNSAIPCGLILNELLSNALKYAFPEARRGAIVVGFRVRNPAELVLSVEDDGIGIPPGLDWKNANSLGLRIVQILTRQLDASVTVSSAHGTRFEIVLPAPHP